MIKVRVESDKVPTKEFEFESMSELLGYLSYFNFDAEDMLYISYKTKTFEISGKQLNDSGFIYLALFEYIKKINKELFEEERRKEIKVSKKEIKAPKRDDINHPEHYCFSKIEPIEVIEDWNLPFHLGNVVKYIARWDKKGGVEDLKKAKWYLERFLERNKNG